jgi:hypothetical protein
MPNNPVTVSKPDDGPSTMDAATLTSSPRGRRLGVSALARRVRSLGGQKSHRADVCVRMDPGLRVDPAEIDTGRWTEWAEENLTPLELDRMKRAAEADRCAQGITVC